MEEAKARFPVCTMPGHSTPSKAILTRRMPKGLLYQRPSYSDDARLFSDLLAYAPGMNTSLADIEAVIEAEAMPSPLDKPGQIDAGARKLFAQAASPAGRR